MKSRSRIGYYLTSLSLLLAGCRQDMYNQPRAKTYAESDFFANGSSARPLPPNTVEYHYTRLNDPYFTGLSGDTLVAYLPAPLKLTPELLAHGRQRFEIYCAPCHGQVGDGMGEIVKRGYPAPPTYHSERLRKAPLGHFYDVITNGYGVMYSYASRLEPDDRWAVAAYVRALQLSQHASPSDLPPNEQRKLEEQP